MAYRLEMRTAEEAINNEKALSRKKIQSSEDKKELFTFVRNRYWCCV